MTPIWVTMLVAVLSVFGALGAQWLNTMRAFRLAEIERRAKREERHQQNREDTYAKFLVAARALRPALRSGTGEAALAALRDAAAYIELNAPELADRALAAVLDSGERWAELVLTSPPTAPVIKEADEEFHQAVRAMRDLMRNDLASE
ncbi:hypothetical protein [Lentzea albidocapillata]|nr:hypothetical protein [Lentzea albidocapillata]